jgi:superfamily II DNA or RNA helicase
VSLITRASQFVPADIRRRGADDVQEGRVVLTGGSSERVTSTVQENETFNVSLTRGGADLEVACSCPHPTDRGVCRHIWGTLVAAERSSYLGSLKQRGEWMIELIQRPAGDPGKGVATTRSSAPPPPMAAPGPAPVNGSARLKPVAKAPPPPSGPPEFESILPLLRHEIPPVQPALAHEIGYFVDLPESQKRGALCLDVLARVPETRTKPAHWKAADVAPWAIAGVPDATDAGIFTALLGARAASTTIGTHGEYSTWQFQLARAGRELIGPMVARSGRGYLRRAPNEHEPALLRWDEGEPWQLRLKVTITESRKTGEDWEVAGVLQRGKTEMPLAAPELILEGGILIESDTVARLDDGGAWPWIEQLRRHGRFRIPAGSQDAFLQQIFALPRLPVVDLPEGRALLEVNVPPTPCVRIHPGDQPETGPQQALFAELDFDYDRLLVPARTPGRLAYDARLRRLVRRDPAAEEVARARLTTLDFKPIPTWMTRPRDKVVELQIAPTRLSAVVAALVADGFRVEASGKVYRSPGTFNVDLRSGIDWFDLHGSVDFGGVSAELVTLLESLRRGETTVTLGDGSVGLLPEEWLARYGMLASLGQVEGGSLRFQKNQAGLLDVLLSAQPEIDVDASFAKIQAELHRFEAPKAMDPPKTFKGELRGYQKEGLGWLHFLQRFGFGGCLADDMGLGKTVQVLALLITRKAKRKSKTPSLVVAPRSLIFNWKNEAAHFTPSLRVLEHTGAGRLPPGAHFEDYDLILTTYGTLRRDAVELSAVEFDYVILDEATAIKNDRSEAAKAARLLKAAHRLALSGTPVENHLGELWSLFEFLNPGMLGRASVFKKATSTGRDLDEATVALLAKALRPFLLRRTKGEVAKELPDRMEETIMCELEPPQRALYDGLRRHYQSSLLERVRTEGLSKSKIHVLEALLRLRQAACHPALVDETKREDTSAKLEALFDELPSLREKKQKALVFSQFTSLLSLVRDRLDQEKIVYEYLDGKTRDRQARVERFQTDPDCPLFLISLKAGGMGLNLTAAEYVFLLDPWWNPAVEAQAIDRAHRIGQKRAVFAYRLIAKDTIEERITELQQKKKKLAESVIEGDGGLVKDLTPEDLQLLLS